MSTVEEKNVLIVRKCNAEEGDAHCKDTAATTSERWKRGLYACYSNE